MKRLVFIAFFSTISAYAQIDTTDMPNYKAQEIVVLKKIEHIDHPNHNIDREVLENSSFLTVGDALKSTPGITIKDYGGIGGLQTISGRSLGANHSGVMLNGVLLSGSGSGQINLSNISVNSIEKITYSVGSQVNTLLPATAYRFANMTNIQTISARKSFEKLKIISSFGYGSFATTDGSIGIKSSFKKLFFSVNVNYLNSIGNYPYQIPNSGQDDTYARQNAAIFRYQTDLSLGLNTKIGKTHLSYLRNYSNQELPGAAVLFVFNNEQYLRQGTDQLSLSHTYKKNKLSLRGFVNYQYQSTSYLDSNVFNIQGYTHDHYYFSKLQSGISMNYQFTRKTSLYSSLSYDKSWLNSSRNNLKDPTRNEILAVVGAKHLFQKIRAKLEGNVLFQGIFDKRSNTNQKETYQLNPFISFAISPIKNQDFRVRLFYKNSSRLPSFNEMYYSQIGNLDLKPENAHQVNLGFTYALPIKTYLKKLMFNLDFYQNFVQNKIVAIPTKDLFIWSILNVEKVAITGVDLQTESNIKITKKTILFLNANYTFQKALNKTDKEHITYNNQIAYIPEHQTNTTIGMDVYGAFFNWTSSFTGTRYHLNENNQANELNPFWTNDITLGYARKIKKNKLKISFSIINLADVRFNVIRSFPMIGRHYKLKLIYAFN